MPFLYRPMDKMARYVVQQRAKQQKREMTKKTIQKVSQKTQVFLGLSGKWRHCIPILYIYIDNTHKYMHTMIHNVNDTYIYI